MSELNIIPDPLVQPGPVTPPDLSTLLDLRIQNALAATNCHSIGTITAFYPETQTADVTMVFLRTIINAPEQNVTEQTPIVLVDCPVICLGGGDAALTFPIAAGDTCLICFNDRAIDDWFVSGQVLPAPSLRIHDFADAIVVVGVRPTTASLASYNATKTQLRQATSNVTLSDSSAALNQGSNTVAVEDKIKIAVGVNTLLTALDDLLTALIGATISGTTFSAGTISALTTAKAEIDAILK